MNNTECGVLLPTGEKILFEGSGVDNGKYRIIEDDSSNILEAEKTLEEIQIQSEEINQENNILAETNNYTIVDINGNEVDYYQASYIEQLKTNMFLQSIFILIPSLLILKWLYGGIKKMFHVSI